MTDMLLFDESGVELSNTEKIILSQILILNKYEPALRACKRQPLVEFSFRLFICELLQVSRM